MKKLFVFSWGNIIIAFFLFYFIGTVYTQLLLGINKGIRNFQQYQANKEREEYLQSDEYKVSQLDLDIARQESEVDFNKTTYEHQKQFLDLYSKKEIEESKEKYLSEQKKLDSLIKKRNEFHK
jgi:uncharacterized membrane protein YhiD involved in acid resistance